jgi:hypothetical protein
LLPQAILRSERTNENRGDEEERGAYHHDIELLRNKAHARVSGSGLNVANLTAVPSAAKTKISERSRMSANGLRCDAATR